MNHMDSRGSRSNPEALKKAVIAFVREYIAHYPEDTHVPQLWRSPLVGFADAHAPYIQNLPHLVVPSHHLPQDFLEDASAVICYFLPFRQELARTNAGNMDGYASPEWAEAYEITNTLIRRLNQALTVQIGKWGYRAVVPENIRTLPSVLMSNWSQRHLAYAAGLGTFGLNNMLISKQGCCGRYGSIVSDIPVKTDDMLKGEYCLYKSSGICQICVKNCVTGALTVGGFDRKKCHVACEKNMERYGVDVCGKCDVNIPCAFVAPGLKGYQKETFP